jgi:cold shock CspA family protein
MLKEEGIVRHDVLCAGNREIGADVELALVVHELALARCFDIAALITGDADFLPLINRLRASGIGVLIPSFTQADGALHAVRTSPALIQAADHAPSWEHLLTCGLDPDYRLRYPFTAPVKGATSQRAADGYRYGTVNKWQDGAAFGFITDTDGVNWFVSKQALPPDLKSLSVGRQVRFNGRPRPTPGKPYPEARAVQPHEPEEPGTESRDR